MVSLLHDYRAVVGKYILQYWLQQHSMACLAGDRPKTATPAPQRKQVRGAIDADTF